MPNGEDKNWVRLCGALEGFFLRYGHWPTRLRLPAYAYEDFRHLFKPSSLQRLLEQFDIYIDDDYFAAESNGGRRYDYMIDGFPDSRPPVSAPAWLSLNPNSNETETRNGYRSEDAAVDARYDLKLGTRHLSWLRPPDLIREVIRFFIQDLGFEPDQVVACVGRKLWRSLAQEQMLATTGVNSLTARDTRSDINVADVVRAADGSRLLLHDEHGWREYREILYRLDSVLPFGVMSWRRTELLERQAIVAKLGLTSGSANRRRVQTSYGPPPERNRPIENCYWVSAEPLLAGEYPWAPDEREGTEKLKRLISCGINCFIDLTTKDDRLIAYRARDVAPDSRPRPEYHRYPIPAAGTISVDSLAVVLDAIDDALDRRLSVYVHDRGGLGRSALVIGCHLTRRGLSGDDALTTVQTLVRSMPKARNRRSPESSEQRRLVRIWPDLDPIRKIPS